MRSGYPWKITAPDFPQFTQPSSRISGRCSVRRRNMARSFPTPAPIPAPIRAPTQALAYENRRSPTRCRRATRGLAPIVRQFASLRADLRRRFGPGVLVTEATGFAALVLRVAIGEAARARLLRAAVMSRERRVFRPSAISRTFCPCRGGTVSVAIAGIHCTVVACGDIMSKPVRPVPLPMSRAQRVSSSPLRRGCWTRWPVSGWNRGRRASRFPLRPGVMTCSPSVDRREAPRAARPSPRRSPMTDPKRPTPFVRPRQLTIASDPRRLRGMGAAERQTAVTILATLLTEATAPGTGGGDDEPWDAPRRSPVPEGGGPCPAIDPGTGRDRSREPQTALRAGRGCPLPRVSKCRGHRRRPRPVGARHGGRAGLRASGGSLVCRGDRCRAVLGHLASGAWAVAIGTTCWSFAGPSRRG